MQVDKYKKGGVRHCSQTDRLGNATNQISAELRDFEPSPDRLQGTSKTSSHSPRPGETTFTARLS